MQYRNDTADSVLTEMRTGMFHFPPREESSEERRPPTMIYRSRGRRPDPSTSGSSLRRGEPVESDSTSVMRNLPLIPVTKSLLMKQPTPLTSSSKSGSQFSISPPPPPPPPPPFVSDHNNINVESVTETRHQQTSSLTEPVLYSKGRHAEEAPNLVLEPLSTAPPSIPPDSYHSCFSSSPSGTNPQTSSPPLIPVRFQTSAPASQTLSSSTHTPTSSHALSSSQSDEAVATLTSPRDNTGHSNEAIGDSAGEDYLESPSLHVESASQDKSIPLSLQKLKDNTATNTSDDRFLYLNKARSEILEEYPEGFSSHSNDFFHRGSEDISITENRIAAEDDLPQKMTGLLQHALESNGQILDDTNEFSPIFRERHKRKTSLASKNVEVLKLQDNVTTVRHHIKPGTVGELANLFTSMKENQAISSLNQKEFDPSIQEALAKLDNLDKNKEDMSVLVTAPRISSADEILPAFHSSELSESHLTLDESHLSGTDESPGELLGTDMPPEEPGPMGSPVVDYLSASKQLFKFVVSKKKKKKSSTDLTKESASSKDQETDSLARSHEEERRLAMSPLHKPQVPDRVLISETTHVCQHVTPRNTRSKLFSPNPEIGNTTDHNVDHIIDDGNLEDGAFRTRTDLHPQPQMTSDAELLRGRTDSVNKNARLNLNSNYPQCAHASTIVINSYDKYSDTPGNAQTSSTGEIKESQVSVHSQYGQGTETVDKFHRDSDVWLTRSEPVVISPMNGNRMVGANTGDVAMTDGEKKADYFHEAEAGYGDEVVLRNRGYSELEASARSLQKTATDSGIMTFSEDTARSNNGGVSRERPDEFMSILQDISIDTDITSGFLRRSSRRSGAVSDEEMKVTGVHHDHVDQREAEDFGHSLSEGVGGGRRLYRSELVLGEQMSKTTAATDELTAGKITDLNNEIQNQHKELQEVASQHTEFEKLLNFDQPIAESFPGITSSWSASRKESDASRTKDVLLDNELISRSEDVLGVSHQSPSRQDTEPFHPLPWAQYESRSHIVLRSNTSTDEHVQEAHRDDLSDRSSLSNSNISYTGKHQDKETSFNSKFFATSESSIDLPPSDSAMTEVQHPPGTENKNRSEFELENSSYLPKVDDFEKSLNFDASSLASSYRSEINRTGRHEANESRNEGVFASEENTSIETNRSTSRQNSLLEATGVSRSEYSEKSSIEFRDSPEPIGPSWHGHSDERRTSLSSAHSSVQDNSISANKETSFSKEFFTSEHVSDVPSRKHSLIVATESSRSLPWSDYEDKPHIKFNGNSQSEQHIQSEQHVRSFFGQSLDTENRTDRNNDHVSFNANESMLRENLYNSSERNGFDEADNNQDLTRTDSKSSWNSEKNVPDQLKNKADSSDDESKNSTSPERERQNDNEDSPQKLKLESPHGSFITEGKKDHIRVGSGALFKPAHQTKETYAASIGTAFPPPPFPSKEDESTKRKESHLFSKDAFQSIKNIFEGQAEQSHLDRKTSFQSKRSSYTWSPVHTDSSSKNQQNGGVSNENSRDFTSQHDAETRSTPEADQRVLDLHRQPRLDTEIDTVKQIDAESTDSSDESDGGGHVDARGERISKKKSKQNYFSYDLQTRELTRNSFSQSDGEKDSSLRDFVNEPKPKVAATVTEITGGGNHSPQVEQFSEIWNTPSFSNRFDKDSESGESVKRSENNFESSVDEDTYIQKSAADALEASRSPRESVRDVITEPAGGQSSSEHRDNSPGVQRSSVLYAGRTHSASETSTSPRSSPEHGETSYFDAGGNRYPTEYARADLHRKLSFPESDKSRETDKSSRRSSTASEDNRPAQSENWVSKQETDHLDTSDTKKSVLDELKTAFSRQTSNPDSDFPDGERKQSSTGSDKQSELIDTFLRSSSAHPSEASTQEVWKSSSHIDTDNQHEPVSPSLGDSFSNLNSEISNTISHSDTAPGFLRTLSADSSKEETMTAVVGKVSSFGIHKKVSSSEESFGVTNNTVISQSTSRQAHHDQTGSDVYLIQDSKGDYYALQEVDDEQSNPHGVNNKTHGVKTINNDGHQTSFPDSANTVYYTEGGARTDLYVDSAAVEEDKAREVISAYLDSQESGKQQHVHTTSSGAYTLREGSTTNNNNDHHYTHTGDREQWDSSSGDGSTSFVSPTTGYASVVVQQEGYSGSHNTSSHSEEHMTPAGYKRLSLNPTGGHANSSAVSGNMHVAGDSQTWKKSRFEHLNPESKGATYTSSLVVNSLSTPGLQHSYSGPQRVVDTAHNTHWSSGPAATIQPLTSISNHNVAQPVVHQFPATPVTITTTTQAVVGEQVDMHIGYSPTTTGNHLTDAFNSSSSSDDDSNQKRYVINSPQKSALKKTSRYSNNSLSDSSSDIVFNKTVIPTEASINGRARHYHRDDLDGNQTRIMSTSGSLSPRSVVDGTMYKVYQPTQSHPARSLSPADTQTSTYPRNGTHYRHDAYNSSSLSKQERGENLYRIRNLSTSVPSGLNLTEDPRGRSTSRSSKHSDKLYKVRKQPHSPDRFFRNPKLSLRKEDYTGKDYFSDDETDNKMYRTVTKVYLNNNQQNSESQKSDTHYKISSHHSHTSFENSRGQVQEDGKIYEVVKVKSSDDQRSGSPGLSESDSGYQEQQPRYKIVGSSDSSKDLHRVEARSSPIFDGKNVESYGKSTIIRTKSAPPTRLNTEPPQTRPHKTVIQLEMDGNKGRSSPRGDEPSYMVKRVKSAENLLSENLSSYSSADRRLWRTGRSRSTDLYKSQSSSEDESDHKHTNEFDTSSRMVKTLKQKDGKKTYVVNSTVSNPRDNNPHPPGWYTSTIDINEEAPEKVQDMIFNRSNDSFSQSRKLSQERSDSHGYRTEKTVYFVRETAPTHRNTHSSDFFYPDSGQGTEATSSDGENEVRQKVERVERIYEIRTEPELPENFESMEDLSNDLRVLRGNILIKNRLNETGHDDDDFDENVNLFDNSFHLGKDNPLFNSDPDILASLQREEEEELAKRLEQDITFETVDRIAHKYKSERQVTASPQRKKQNLSQLLLSKLANVDSKDIRQTIDVEHHNEEIYGDIDFIHADGQRKSSSNTRNFDSVNEKVELTLTQGKAYVIIKVIAERIVPTDYEFNVWRKSQAIVTRQIEIDLLANEQRRRLYKHVMASAGTAGSLEDGRHHHYQDTDRLSPQERQLSSMETLKLFSQILDVTDGQGDKDFTDTRTRQEMGQLPPSAMDLLY